MAFILNAASFIPAPVWISRSWFKQYACHPIALVHGVPVSRSGGATPVQVLHNRPAGVSIPARPYTRSAQNS
jgi:hypothetical protein